MVPEGAETWNLNNERGRSSGKSRRDKERNLIMSNKPQIIGNILNAIETVWAHTYTMDEYRIPKADFD